MSWRNFLLSLFLLSAANIFLVSTSWSQSYSRLSNPRYMQTRLVEKFDADELDRNVWRVVSNTIKNNLYIFADTLATVNQTGNSLELSMHRHPGFSAQTWSPEGDVTITANFIGGEVMTVEDYSYGIFECSATLAPGKGSFPAFWLYSDAMCFETERPEIDIVELKANRRNPTLDNNIWYYPFDCLPQTAHEFTEHSFSWGGTHTFKGVWTPDRIEFWVDDILLKIVFNTGQYWYPKLPQHVLLSQQIVRYGRLFPDSARIETPQTSRFHWVKVREFFLAPEITCPENIYTTVLATLDVDEKASEISWELTPKNIFAGRTSGSGRKVIITPATRFHGLGKLIYRFKMPTGESFSAEKEIVLNGLE
jgi:hypothetical protein